MLLLLLLSGLSCLNHLYLETSSCNLQLMASIKETLHLKLALDFLAGLKVYIFGKFLQ